MARKTGFASMAAEMSDDLGDIDKLLGDLDHDLRTKGLKKAGKRAGLVVAKAYKQTAPTGKTGNLKSAIPTKLSQIKTFASKDEKVITAVMKLAHPKGAHAHLVEFGHKIRARGKKGADQPGKWIGRSTTAGDQLANAAKNTEPQQTAAIIKSLAKDIEKQGG